ncbi:ribose-5-phosphate isomerase A [Candidatus Woesearchaeota archaeon]|nr:ribose-5-phosphate isomerase A [Candidatus Woesearchaeota archaeon]
MTLSEKEKEKIWYEAGKASLKFVSSDAKVVVFGAGRTVLQALQAFFDKGLYKSIGVICASQGTKKRVLELGINVLSDESLEEGNYVYIDGADQIDPEKNIIKGGYKGTGDPGIEGVMYREKQLAYKAGTFIIIADESKLVDFLGQGEYGLPIEFEPDMSDEVKTFLKGVFPGRRIKLREGDDGVFYTENSKQIFDVTFDGKEHNLAKLEEQLEEHDGVYSTGLFSIGKPDKIVVASSNGVEVL